MPCHNAAHWVPTMDVGAVRKHVFMKSLDISDTINHHHDTEALRGGVVFVRALHMNVWKIECPIVFGIVMQCDMQYTYSVCR